MPKSIRQVRDHRLSKEEVERIMKEVQERGGPLADIAKSLVAERDECLRKAAELEERRKDIP